MQDAHQTTSTAAADRERRLRAVNAALREEGWSIDLQPDAHADPAQARADAGPRDAAQPGWGPDVVAILEADRRRRDLHLRDAIRRGHLTAYRVRLLDERGAEVAARTVWAEPGKAPGRREDLSILGARVIAGTVREFSEALGS